MSEGAIPNGTRVKKVNSEPKDRTPEGTLGTISGHIDTEDFPEAKAKFPHVKYAYLVWFDGEPRAPIFTLDYKVTPVND